MEIRSVVKKDETQLRSIAKDILEPLYGSQEKAIEEWLTGKGCKEAFVFLINGNIAGLLVLKVNPNKNFLKISTLVVIKKFRGMRVGKRMLDFAIKFAKKENIKILL